MAGQDETAVKRGLDNCAKTDISWDLYFNGRADEAVSAFGQSTSTLGDFYYWVNHTIRLTFNEAPSPPGFCTLFCKPSSSSAACTSWFRRSTLLPR
jgi:hypothetical protein